MSASPAPPPAFRFSDTDLVRFFVIISLSLCCVLIMALSFLRDLGPVSYPLFFIPVLYASYFYPKRGIWVASVCALVFLGVGTVFVYPDLLMLFGLLTEAVLLVLIAIAVTYLIDRIREGELRYRSVFENSQLGIVLFSRADFSILQFNSRFLDMLHYTADEIRSRDIRSLLHNAREKERFQERIQKEITAEDFETRFSDKEGDACWVNLSWSAIDENTFTCTAMNINARKLAEKANNDNMMKYRQLTEHSPICIVIVQDGKIRFSNPAFSAFSGFKPIEIVGKEILDLVDPADRDRYVILTASQGKNTADPEKSQVLFLTKDAGTRIGSLSAMPVMHSGKPAIMLNIMDLSEKQKLEERIRLDNERRRGIIITVAHEMRTPLQPILGYLNLLISDPDGFGITNETKKILERCLASVDRERQIINQMLELSVLESGKLELSYSDVPVAPLIGTILENGGYATKAEISQDIPADCVVHADRERLHSVIDSILTNAINYSKSPRKIRIVYRGDGSHHLISVQDNGVGIPQTALASIFEPFQLADASKLSRKYDRIGLSLSIAKKVIEMHGGDILVESEENIGSTFTIQLPKEAPHVP